MPGRRAAGCREPPRVQARLFAAAELSGRGALPPGMDPEFWLLALKLAQCTQSDKDVDVYTGFPPMYKRLADLSEHHGRLVWACRPTRPGPSVVEEHVQDLFEKKIFPSPVPLAQIDNRRISKELEDRVWGKLQPVGRGLDPTRFRVSHYGEYVSWITNQRKGNRLECFVLATELVGGVSQQLFLQAFESQSAAFRHVREAVVIVSRSLRYFFQAGEGERAVEDFDRASGQQTCRPGNGKKYRWFTPQETADLVEGYLHFGPQWMRILSLYPSLSATRDNIKTMQKNGQLDAMLGSNKENITLRKVQRSMNAVRDYKQIRHRADSSKGGVPGIVQRLDYRPKGVHLRNSLAGAEAFTN
eukprot:SM000112S23989  [mRNA]  locus=s112:239360:242349:+ [translate_table: standard]